MKEKMKPMLIGAGIGVAGGAGIAFLMKKTDSKNLIIFSIVGLAIGAGAAYFVAGKKEEKKSEARGFTTTYEQNQIGSDVISPCNPSGGLGNMTFPCKYNDKVYKNYNEFMTS